ncbi:MAG: beta-galactosidase trimerization domain-containing protein, partial [Gemmataceae bacterium]
HQKRTMTGMLDEIIAVARKHRPDILVSLNGGPESFPDEVMQRVDFIYAEPLPCPTGIALGSILMRGWGRPYFQAGIFTQYGYVDIYPGSIPRVQADALVLQNARTFFVGNAPIISGLDGQGFSKRWFAVAKETWEDVRAIDCLLGPNIHPLLSTAILYSESTRKELDAAKRPVDFRQSILGALEVLSYAGRPVESLPEFRLEPENLQPFDTLVLPEVDVLSDRQAGTIREWVRKGGTLIASYKCGLLDENHRTRKNFALADVLGIDYIAEDRTYAYDDEGKLRPGGFISTYLESAGHPLAKMVSVSTVGLPGSFLRTKSTTAEEVMRYRLPFMVQDMARHQYFNWGPPPPGSQTAGTAAAYNKFGKGQSLYLGVPIFWAMQWRPFWIQDWIPAVVRQLVPNPLAELRPDPFSQYVHGTFFCDATKHSVLVQALNTVELATHQELCPASRVEIHVDPHRLPVAAARVVWPRERNLALVERDGRTIIILENLSRYAALYLRLW